MSNLYYYLCDILGVIVLLIFFLVVFAMVLVAGVVSVFSGWDDDA